MTVTSMVASKHCKIGPLAEMLGAGNRVIIKPSEYTPACAELVTEMIAATYDRDLVYVAVGGLDLSQAFAATPWDHLRDTGMLRAVEGRAPWPLRAKSVACDNSLTSQKRKVCFVGRACPPKSGNGWNQLNPSRTGDRGRTRPADTVKA